MRTMTAKPTATLQVEWCAQKTLLLREIIARDENGQPVALKVIGEPIQDPVLDTPDRQLHYYAGKVAGHVEQLVSACKYSLSDVSRDAARCARSEVRDAMELLQAFEGALAQRVDR